MNRELPFHKLMFTFPEETQFSSHLHESITVRDLMIVLSGYHKRYACLRRETSSSVSQAADVILYRIYAVSPERDFVSRTSRESNDIFGSMEVPLVLILKKSPQSRF